MSLTGETDEAMTQMLDLAMAVNWVFLLDGRLLLLDVDIRHEGIPSVMMSMECGICILT